MGNESKADVFGSVDSDAVDAKLVDAPHGPLLGFGHDIRVFVVDIAAHQVIKVAFLVVDIF